MLSSSQSTTCPQQPWTCMLPCPATHCRWPQQDPPLPCSHLPLPQPTTHLCPSRCLGSSVSKRSTRSRHSADVSSHSGQPMFLRGGSSGAGQKRAAGLL